MRHQLVLLLLRTPATPQQRDIVIRKGGNSKFGSCAHSKAATLSFHAIKHITTGEGGVLLTNDKQIAEQAKLLRSHGMVRNAEQLQNKKYSDAPWYYEMHELGYNYRLSDLNCALAIHQIDRLKKTFIGAHRLRNNIIAIFAI